MSLLLLTHIVAGFAALGAALAATVAKTADQPHRWHVWSGTAFAGAMAVVIATAIPLALIGESLFLLLIAVFSGYLAATGWRLAKNRRGTPAPLDWGLAALMAVAAVAMLAFGLRGLIDGASGGVVLLVFGAIGASMLVADVRTFRAGGEKGRERVASHLSRMLGASIATLTAFAVTNLEIGPDLAKWLGPTLLITPVIVWWSRRIQAGAQPRGMPETSTAPD